MRAPRPSILIRDLALPTRGWAKGYSTPGPSNLNQKSVFEDFDNCWRQMPTKWLQERHNGSKNDTGIGFEGPGVVTMRMYVFVPGRVRNPGHSEGIAISTPEIWT
jgi:hypothetical protein